MGNLLKMDLYRMFKSKVTWLCILGTAIMMLSSVFLTSSDIKYYTSHQEELKQIEENAGGGEDWGIYIGSVMPMWCKGAEAPVVDLIANNVQSKILLIFLVVFLVDFVSGENKSGFLLNIAGQVSNRGYIIISKIVITAIYSFIQLLSTCAIIGLSSKLFLGYINLDRITDFIPFITMQLLLQIAFGTLIIFIVTLTKSTIASLVISILLSSGIVQVADPLFRIVLNKLKSFSIMYYTISGNIGQLSVGSSSTIYLRSLAITALVIIVTSAISIYLIQKRDV